MTGLGEDLPRDARTILRRGLLVWGALVVLAAATVLLAFVPLGRLNMAASLGIAAAKALLIALFFMNLRRPDPLLRLAGFASLLWIGFLFALTFADQLTRAPVTQPGTVTPRTLSSGPGTGQRQF
ncbi:cytochrome C oxidase subunit IV family protein [Roseomonas sp. BN140053]|uniref:cytochrome C oxidase subunit IV family protein n=1 Tax=Roseomonas sp. BN140053 TaxID=3391898 RepID=UPI0039E9F953